MPFETSRRDRETFDLYGDETSFEWAQIENAEPVVHVGEKPARVPVPDYARLMPEPIRSWTRAPSGATMFTSR